jgi:hypothetical protein
VADIMGKALSAKALLLKQNDAYLSDFKLNQDMSLSLPVVSSIPWISASKRQNYFEKVIYPSDAHHIKFITQNHQPHSFVWQTTAQTLKNATRWGIVKTESITGQVIAALGQYRVTAYTRISQGMMSNTQQQKLALLDMYQDRFEALQALESCVNQDLSDAAYDAVFEDYIQKLIKIRDGLDHLEIIKAIDVDINKTKVYLANLKSRDLLSASREARGSVSVLEFVKQQMIEGLYELQGINQDLTYNRNRSFALTRGEFNSHIEDARKVLNDHQADLWNRVTDKHHGLYAADGDDLVSYDFSEDDLSPERERDVLLAISFIEGWDQLSNKNGVPTVKNNSGEEKLDVIAATRWQTHRDIWTLFKSLGYYALNSLKSIFIETYPWNEEAWENPHFHLFATTLRRKIKPNEPLWKKPIKFFKHVFHEVLDILTGIRDFGVNLVIRMPAVILNDWESSHVLPALETVLAEAGEAANLLKNDEMLRLQEMLKRCDFVTAPPATPHTSALAHAEYALTAGEQNDLLTAMAKGIHAFNSVFLHTIHAKDPIGGLLFSAAYGVGVGAIYFPAHTASILGAQYVNGFSHFSYSMGGSQCAAAIAGGSSQAQMAAMGWDSFIDGPSSRSVDALYALGKDPLTYGAYFAAAYTLGYLLTNGLAGHEIPWLSEHLKADLGTNPKTGYPVIGGKVAILSGESLEEVHHHAALPTKIAFSDDYITQVSSILSDEHQAQLARFQLIIWLSMHAEWLPRLDRAVQHALSRQIDALFSREASASLHKLLYPVKTRSIAFQLLSLPLSYIPVILRVVLSAVLSVLAYTRGNALPFAPIQNACTALLDKTAKDLSRLIAFTIHALYLPYVFISSMIKNIAAIAMMAIGRVASAFDVQVSLMLYQSCAAVHVFCRSWTAFFFPTRMLQSVDSAHPNHTIKAFETEQTEFLQSLGKTPAWTPCFFSGAQLPETQAVVVDDALKSRP